MNFFFKTLKWIGITIGSLLLLVILAGLVFRLCIAESHKPVGRLIDIDGVKLHISSSGEKSSTPTLVIESGAGLSSEYYYWLNEGLKDSLRVVRYDRAGIGYSELSSTSRDPETIAQELHKLLEKAGESPPYILAGHSLGGVYMRVFTELYRDEVAAMVFIDATHPEQVERFNAAPQSSFKFKSVLWSLSIATFFGDMGVLGLAESFTEPIFAGDGLPDEVNTRTRDFLLNGKCLRAYKAEIKNYHDGLKRAGKANKFDSLPIRVFTAIEINKESYRERGIDPEEYLNKVIEAQKEFTSLSTRGRQFLIDGNHQTIFTKKENADIICREIIQMLETLKSESPKI